MVRKANTTTWKDGWRAVAAGLLFHLCIGCTSSGSAQVSEIPVTADVWASPAALAALPDGPERAITIEYCAVCHELDRVVKAGGTEQGWAERISRMIRHGATIPRDKVPPIAAYLAKAFPPRLRPQE